MKNKSILGLGIALALFASVTVSAFAFGWSDGVRWEIVELNRGGHPGLYIQLLNGNEHAVRVGLSNSWANAGFVELAPEELRNVAVADRNARITFVLNARTLRPLR